MAFYLIFKSYLFSLVCFLSGILVDVDHIFDYLWCMGWDLNIKRFFDFAYGVRYQRLSIVLHAHEYIILIVFILMATGDNLFIIAVGVGYVQHLLFDQIFNPVKPMAYFLSYRLKHGFSRECLLRDDFLSSIQGGD